MIPRYSRPEMSSIWTEQAKYDRWLQVEIAAVKAWSREGVISDEESELISQNAKFVLEDINRYQNETHHDVTAFIRSISDHLGPEARWIHHGLTSSDVWDTATALQLRDSTVLLEAGLQKLHSTLVTKAREHRTTIMVGRTHGVHAEPITFGLVLAIWVDEIRRGQKRLTEAKRTIGYGKISGAVGTHATVPPQIEDRVCETLGLEVAPASNQILQRDRHSEYLSTLALIAASLEKFALEIRHLQRTEVSEAAEPFAAGQTGSSAMPHKRNPEKCERICGLARVIRGFAGTGLENVALWHERDISHSSTERIILPGASILLDYMLDLFNWVMEGLVVFPNRMKQNLNSSFGLVYSQRVLLALVEAGISRNEAYKIVQNHSMVSWEKQTPLLELLSGDESIIALLSNEKLLDCFDPSYYLKNADVTFERLGI